MGRELSAASSGRRTWEVIEVTRFKDFIPPLSFDLLTPMYDPLIRWTMREHVMKSTLLQHAGIAAGVRLLDVGCGTGTLAVMAKQDHPEADIVGLDPDAAALEVARTKSAGLDIVWEQGRAEAIPFGDETFDRVLASLMLHHLDRPTKLGALREMRRVLTSQGRLLVLDFTVPGSAVAHLQARLLRRLEHVDDNFAGLIPDLICQAGFGAPVEVGRFGSIFGDVSIQVATPA